MKEGNRRRCVLTAVGMVLLAAGACSVIRPLIYPVKYDRVSKLNPTQELGEGYCLSEDGSLSYEIEGLRIDVKCMPDPDLNALFPEESTQGRYSLNPYTYGNWVDASVGYVPNRFTVFQVTVTNVTFAQVELQPLECLLTTDRPGEVLRAYGVSSGSAPQSFESYYRALTGPSGNEDYRFSMRMGLVRTNNYAVGERIYKGEQYSGFVVFGPLADEVTSADLHLRDFILKFSAFGKPLETMDVSFHFRRTVEQQVMRSPEAVELAQAYTESRLSAATQVQGNAAGDVTRDATAIEGYARSQLSDINECFEGPFLEGGASEGEVALRFAVASSGQVEDVEILRSTVSSDQVDLCIEQAVTSWRLRPSAGGASVASPASDQGERGPGTSSQTAAAPATVPSTARVTATLSLGFSDVRED